MFEKLKQKLKVVKEKLTRKIAEKKEEPVIGEKEPVIEEKEEEIAPEPTPVKPAKLAKKILEEKKPVQPSVLKVEKPTRPEVKKIKRIVKRVIRHELSQSDIDDILWDLQVSLLESDVAVIVTDRIIELVKKQLVGRKVGLKENPKYLAEEALEKAIKEVLTPPEHVELLKIIEAKRTKGEPAVVVFFGINGTGKTTTISKVAKYLQNKGYKVVLAAADTFRAAGIEQLEAHAQRLGVKVIKQRRGADAAAVAYDAVAHAKAQGIDVVLIDTAGRMQTDVNLMDEMRKIVRVVKPDLRIFVGDALTGNDAIEQASTFDRDVGIDGSILCKMDADARGGAALSITHVTNKPILFLGNGQRYEDLVEFKPEILIKALLAD